MKKKAIFFDIDGTLVIEETQTILESTIKSLKKAKRNGHLIFINTGRPLCTISKEIYDLEFDGYICGSGTHAYINNKALYEKNIEKSKCLEFVKKLREYKVSGILEGENGMYIDNKIPLIKDLKKFKKILESKGLDVFRDWDDKGLSFSKSLIWFNEDSKRDEFFQYIKNDFGCISLKKGMFEIFQKGYTKATGIKYVQDYLKINSNDCLVIGDSNNDLSMFEHIPNSVLMGNGNPSLFEKVSFVTKNIEDDGIEHALRYFDVI